MRNIPVGLFFEQGHQVVGNSLVVPYIAPLKARKGDPAAISHFEPIENAAVSVSCWLRDGHQAVLLFLWVRVWVGVTSSYDAFSSCTDGTPFYSWQSYGMNDSIHDFYKFGVIEDAEFTSALMHGNSAAGALKHFRFAQCGAGIGCDETGQRLEERVADLQ